MLERQFIYIVDHGSESLYEGNTMSYAAQIAVLYSNSETIYSM